MAFSPNNPNNVRLGRVKVYTAPTMTADPLFTDPPGGSWMYMGWMSAATVLQATTGALEINVDDEVVPVDTVINSRAVGVDGSFAEFDLNVLQRIWGGTLSSVAAGSGAPGYDQVQLKAGDDIPRYAVVVDQKDPREIAGTGVGGNVVGLRRLRAYFPYATIQPNGNSDLSRKKEAGIPFSIRAHPATDGSETVGYLKVVTATGT